MIAVLRSMAFGLWVGSMAAFAFVFAPIAFGQFGATPHFAAVIAQTVTAITRLGYGCAAVIVASASIEWRTRRLSIVPAILALLMCGLGYYEVHVVVAQMRGTPLQTPAYAALHARSSAVYSIILAAGVVGWAIAAWPSEQHRR
jgi:hypothetical protein